MGGALNGKALNEHERRVAEFMAKAEAENPDLYREVVGRHTVLTEKELKKRRERELPLEVLEDWDN